MYEAVAEVEALVGADPHLIQEAWHRIQVLYKSAVNRALPPAQVTLERITAERVALYSYIPPSGENIPVEVHPFQVDESVPEENKIEWAVKQLQNNRSGGPSRMRAEHVKRWLAAAQKADKDGDTSGGKETATETATGGGPDPTVSQEGAENCTRVVDLVQVSFREVKLAEEATWQVVVPDSQGEE